MLSEVVSHRRKWQKEQRARLKDGCDNDSFVYVHLRESDGQPFYVGIGFRVNRPWEMDRDYNQPHKRVVAKHGVRVEIIADNLTWDRACFWEICWIKALRDAGYNLVNATAGGDGVKGLKWREDQKRKLSKVAKIAQNNPQTKELKRQIRHDFIQSEDGRVWRETLSKNRIEFYKTDEGKKVIENHKIKLNNYFQTEKGKEQTKKHSEFTKTQCKGSANPNAVIDENMAQQILDAEGTRSELAVKFGVTYNIVSNIKSRRGWKHLNPSKEA